MAPVSLPMPPPASIGDPDPRPTGRVPAPRVVLALLS